MKRIFIYIIIALSPSLVFAQTPAEIPSPFTLQTKVGSLNAPAKAYLVYRLGANNVIDSSAIVNGKFEFTGKVMNPVNAILVVDHKGIGFSRLDNTSDALSFYIEKATISITSATDSVSKAQITGSPINDDNKRLMAQLKPVIDKVKQLSAEAKAATPAQQQSVDFQNAMQARYKVIQLSQTAIFKDFIKANPNSYLSLLALSSLGPSPDPFEMEPLYNSLSQNLKDTEAGKQIKKSIDDLKLTAVGAIAPEFEQPDTSGKPVKLSSFRGKYVLIDFWASWCGPCREENPNVVKAYNKFKSKNFTILGVSLDKPGQKTNWLNAIKSDGLTWTQVSDLNEWNNAAAVLYAVRSIPHNFLVDPNGKIIAKDLRGSDLDSKLEEIFGKM